MYPFFFLHKEDDVDVDGVRRLASLSHFSQRLTFCRHYFDITCRKEELLVTRSNACVSSKERSSNGYDTVLLVELRLDLRTLSLLVNSLSFTRLTSQQSLIDSHKYSCNRIDECNRRLTYSIIYSNHQQMIASGWLTFKKIYNKSYVTYTLLIYFLRFINLWWVI